MNQPILIILHYHRLVFTLDNNQHINVLQTLMQQMIYLASEDAPFRLLSARNLSICASCGHFILFAFDDDAPRVRDKP